MSALCRWYKLLVACAEDLWEAAGCEWVWERPSYSKPGSAQQTWESSG